MGQRGWQYRRFCRPLPVRLPEHSNEIFFVRARPDDGFSACGRAADPVCSQERAISGAIGSLGWIASGRQLDTRADINNYCLPRMTKALLRLSGNWIPEAYARTHYGLLSIREFPVCWYTIAGYREV